MSLVTIGYNALEGIVSIVAGALAGSISLLGFGADSMIEVASGSAAMWRLQSDADAARRKHAEILSYRIIGVSFLALATYIVIDAISTLRTGEHANESLLGIAIAIVSLIAMPLLARAKRRVAKGLDSRALAADATQTDLCTYLSAILLGGLFLNAAFGWWWADPIAALAMVPFIVKEGVEGVKGEAPCDDCA